MAGSDWQTDRPDSLNQARQLIRFGHDEKLQCLTGDILVENQDMQEVCKKLGFRLQYSPKDRLERAEVVEKTGCELIAFAIPLPCLYREHHIVTYL